MHVIENNMLGSQNGLLTTLFVTYTKHPTDYQIIQTSWGGTITTSHSNISTPKLSLL